MTKRSRIAIATACSAAVLSLLAAPGAFAANAAPAGNTATMAHKSAPRHAKAHQAKAHPSASKAPATGAKK